LLRCVRDGLVDVLATDHAPHTRAEVEPGWKDAWSIPFGNPQLDHFSSMLLTLVNQDVLTLSSLVETLSAGPARLLGLYPRKGTLRVGADADLAIIDMNRQGTLTDEECYTKVKWSPYSGKDYHGRVVMTIANGRVVMQDGAVLGEPGKGRFIRNQAETH